jgi:hypothetical protein
VSVAGNKPPRLQLPYEPGEEYDVEVSCKRVAGADSFNVGIVAGGRRVLAALDGWPTDGFLSGLDLVDKKDVRNNPTTVKGQFLQPDQTHTLTYSVRKEKIDIAVDGKVVVSFRGEFDRLSLGSSYRTPSDKALFLFVGPNTSFQIDRLVVTPVKGRGTILK